jgi:hypothetical protein
MKVTVGVLLITYRGSRDEQPIRWVRLSDFESLQRFVASGTKQAQRGDRIAAEITRLRAQGISDAELLAAGIDVAQFNQMANANTTWPIMSYNVVTRFRTSWLRINRTHQLDTRRITDLRLVQRQQVED